MLESAEVGSTVSKKEYDAVIDGLRVDLINAQYDIRHAPFPLVILIDGDDRAGAADLVDLLNEWMDARFIDTHFFGTPTPEEGQRPPFWRYWLALPANGRIGLFLRAWTVDAISLRLEDRIDDGEFDRRLVHIRRFEEDLTCVGALILKFWIHLPKDELKKRVKLAKKKPDRAWRLDERDSWIVDNYDAGVPVVERALRKTSAASAVWRVIEATDARYRNLAVARTIVDALTAKLEAPTSDPPLVTSASDPAQTLGKGPLDAVDLSATIPYSDYKKKLERYQGRLEEYAHKAYTAGMSSILVFEGWDAAGKGGVIRRITRSMSAQFYRVLPIAAPTDEEETHHYLWRFWRQLPRSGRMLIFDRSWYGRVLVERVEGLAREDQWRRAYEEINDFEEQLVDHGMPVLKFWLHIDPDEQLRRFRAREGTPYKKYKITDEDYRNREKWDAYLMAANEMIARTSTGQAPWNLVAANDKRWARLNVLETVNRALKHSLKAR